MRLLVTRIPEKHAWVDANRVERETAAPGGLESRTSSLLTPAIEISATWLRVKAPWPGIRYWHRIFSKQRETVANWQS